MKEPRHIFQLSCGLTVELIIDEETGRFHCEWSERPTTAALSAITKEYQQWRNEILAAWAQRTGNRVLLVDF